MKTKPRKPKNIPLPLEVRKKLLPATFAEVLKLQPLAKSVQEAANHYLSSVLLAQGVNVAVQSVTIGARQGGILVGFSGANVGMEVVRDKATGALMGILRDPQTGKLVENAREIAGVGKLTTLTNVMSAVVSVAHMISSYDTVKQLKEIRAQLDSIEGQVKFLIDAREWDRKAKLEAIFIHAKRILCNPTLSVEDKREMNGLCRELLELRISWRHELLSKLNCEQTGLPISLRSTLLVVTRLIQISIALESALTWAAGCNEIYMRSMWPSEGSELERVKDLIEKKLRQSLFYKISESMLASDQRDPLAQALKALYMPEETILEQWKIMSDWLTSGTRRLDNALELQPRAP